MVDAARKLLLAVVRLLILADMVDAALLLNSLEVVKGNLKDIKQSSTEVELLNNVKEFNKNTQDLLERVAKRQKDVRNPQVRDGLAAARATLVKQTMMLLTSSKLQMQHPQLVATKHNRDYVFNEVSGALSTIENAAQGNLTSLEPKNVRGLESSLDAFEVR